MKITIDLDPAGPESRRVHFQGGLNDNRHTELVYDALDSLTDAVRSTQAEPHEPEYSTPYALRNQ